MKFQSYYRYTQSIYQQSKKKTDYILLTPDFSLPFLRFRVSLKFSQISLTAAPLAQIFPITLMYTGSNDPRKGLTRYTILSG